MLQTVLAVLAVGLSIGASLHVLLNKREPTSALLWLGVVIAVPYLGSVAYLLFGVNRAGRRYILRRSRVHPLRMEMKERGRREHPIAESHHDSRRLPPHLSPLATLMNGVGRFPVTRGNDLELLDTGDEAFPSMLAAIDGAERTVLLSTFILDVDEVGLSFLASLERAAGRGVACHLLYDPIGSWDLDRSELASARRAGVHCSAFGNRSALKRRFELNLRNHRKILAVDGRVGFTGGMNLSARYQLDSRGKLPVRDNHFRLEGPVVQQLSAAFAEDWYYATGQTLLSADYFPPLRSAGRVSCRVLPSGPDGDREVNQRVLVTALTLARERICIVTPYFVPDKAVRTALILAGRRGVRVQIVVPSRSDHLFVHWAMESYYDELVESGIEIHKREPPFLHTKLLVVDDAWAMVGSSNVDYRSHHLNYELDLSVIGDAALGPILAAVDAERARAEVLSLEERRRRATLLRAWENLWRLFSPML